MPCYNFRNPNLHSASAFETAESSQKDSSANVGLRSSVAVRYRFRRSSDIARLADMDSIISVRVGAGFVRMSLMAFSQDGRRARALIWNYYHALARLARRRVRATTNHPLNSGLRVPLKYRVRFVVATPFGHVGAEPTAFATF